MKNAALLSGSVYHRRVLPKKHSFKYNVIYFYLNLDCVHQFPSLLPIFKFDDRDYMKKHSIPGESIKETVRRLIKIQTGRISEGPIRILTQVRYFGFCFNPVSIYYCFNQEDTRVEYILLEISNTPWNERKVCILECQSNDLIEQFDYLKNFHVSPFMPMDLIWTLQFKIPEPEMPEKPIYVHMEDWDLTKETLFFDATLDLTPQSLTKKNLLREITKNPLLTLKPFFAIYFQALILKLKNIPFYSHPNQEKKL